MRIAAVLLLTGAMFTLPALPQELKETPAQCKSLLPCTEESICIAGATRNCTLSRDARECGKSLNLEVTTLHLNDPACELERQRQNKAYAMDKAICEEKNALEASTQRQNCLAAIEACKAVTNACASLAK